MVNSNPKKILVAEDEKAIAKAMELKLKKSGFDVDAVTSGQEALNMLDKNKYDLVITDLMMPKVDGFKILEEIKTKGISVPVIVTSNLSQEEDKIKATELGASDYFIKSNTPIIEIVSHAKKILGL